MIPLFEPTAIEKIENKWARRHKEKRDQRFARVPYPDALEVYVKAGGPALAVWVCVLYETWRQQKRTVKLPSAEFRHAGIARESRRRGLSRLEEAGYVVVARRAGRSPIVTLTSGRK
jgi:hypothetical protein